MELDESLGSQKRRPNIGIKFGLIQFGERALADIVSTDSAVQSALGTRQILTTTPGGWLPGDFERGSMKDYYVTYQWVKNNDEGFADAGMGSIFTKSKNIATRRELEALKKSLIDEFHYDNLIILNWKEIDDEN